MESAIVVIRPFRREDQSRAQELLKEGTMEPVNRFFISSLTREIMYQAVIMVAALMFIIGGLPLSYTIAAIPTVMLLAYVTIWSAHYYKAKYLHHDMTNIMKSYMGSDKTCFFVAEAFCNKNNPRWKNEKPAFITEVEFEKLDQTGVISNNRDLTRELVGTIAVTRAKESGVVAWVRRKSVNKAWRKKGVASALVDRVTKFCSQKGFIGIELVTTECHDSARRLYEKKGFEVRAFYHKKFFRLSGLAIMMYAMHYKTRPFKDTAVNS